MAWHDLLLHLLHHYGYAFICVIIMFESMGAPLPGESLLIASAVYASTTHRLDIWLVVGAAAIGAIIGDNLGYLIGRSVGARVLVRYGQHVGLTKKRLQIGQYLFRRYGGYVVFFGRFVALLRTFAALLAGANSMNMRMFTLCNALGGIAWASLYGFGGYLLGDAVTHIAGPVGIALAVLAGILVVVVIVYARRHEKNLEQQAERAMQEN